MRKVSLSVLAAALVASGCAQMQQAGFDAKSASAIVGAGIGCVVGAIGAKVTGGNAAVGCVGGAVVGGFAGFEKARREELAAAEQTRTEAVTALAQLPDARKAGSSLNTVPVEVTDKVTHEKKIVQSFDSVTLDIPLSTKGTPQHEAAMAKLRALAERVADERGSCDITIAMTPTDAKARHVALTSAQTQSKNGKPITVTNAADPSLPTGVERVTVKAGKLPAEV